METAGLRELRQNASELVRRAEAGETIAVTVSGREVAQLGPITRGRWRTWDEIAALFYGPADPDWGEDRDRVDQLAGDPFAPVRVVLDTSILLGPPPEPIEGELAISSASLAELHFGVLVARSRNPFGRNDYAAWGVERSFETLPMDAAVARQYGRLAAAVAAIGRQPRARVMDLLIAATAVAHGARLYTRNAADLAGLDDLVEIVAMP